MLAGAIALILMLCGCELERGRLHQIVQRRLRRRVGSQARRGEIGVDRRKHHHGTASRTHAGHAELQQADSPDHVHIVEIEKRRWIGLEDAARKARGGGMNQDVRGAERLGHRRQCFLDRRGRAEIRDQVVIARGAGIDVEPGDARALSLKSFDDRCADAAGRAGHERHTPT